MELKDKEYELLNAKTNENLIAEKQKKDNELLRDALEKEQENSYKMIKDIQKYILDNKSLKENMENRNRELRCLELESKR